MAPLVWLITSCSSDFGRFFAESALARGDKVIAAAQGNASTRAAQLERLGASIVQLDTTASPELLDDKVAELVRIFGHIDVLVNNADYFEGAIFEESSQDMLLESLKTNLVGPLNLTRAILSHMRPRRTGTLIFQGSIAPYCAAPGSTYYAASKGAIDALVPSLAEEVAPWNIRCFVLVGDHYRAKSSRSDASQFRRPTRISDYDTIQSVMEDGCYSPNQKHRDDTMKAFDIVANAIHEDKADTGKTLPLYIPIGPNGFKTIRDSSLAKLWNCEVWENMGPTTTYE